MEKIDKTPEKLKVGINLGSTKSTTIQLKTSSIEILIGGPYKSMTGEDHTYGHAALRVLTKNIEYVYDFGRYRHTRGLFNSEGDGILRIWTSFATYIASENLLGRTTSGYLYEVSDEMAAAVIRHFTILTTNQEKLSSKHPNLTVFKLKYDYDPTDNNCVTTTLAGARIALPKLDPVGEKFNIGRGMSSSEKAAAKMRNFGWPSHIFMPEDLKAMLEDNSSIHPKQRSIYNGK